MGGGGAGTRAEAQGWPDGQTLGPVLTSPTIAIGQLGQGDETNLFREVEGFEMVLQLAYMTKLRVFGTGPIRCRGPPLPSCSPPSAGHGRTRGLTSSSCPHLLQPLLVPWAPLSLLLFLYEITGQGPRGLPGLAHQEPSPRGRAARRVGAGHPLTSSMSPYLLGEAVATSLWTQRLLQLSLLLDDLWRML